MFIHRVNVIEEMQTLLDITIDYYVENKDSIQRFYWLNRDIQNTIVKRECGNLATRKIVEANTAEQDNFLLVGLYMEGLNVIYECRRARVSSAICYEKYRKLHNSNNVSYPRSLDPALYYIIQEDDFYEWYARNRTYDHKDKSMLRESHLQAALTL